MAYFWASVVSAFLAGPVVVLLQRWRKENSSQHAESRMLLEEVIKNLDTVDGSVDKVSDKLDNHITWHLDSTKE
jgi:hypothetical protein